MTERIQNIIEEIRLKYQTLHHQLNEERLVNATAQKEVQILSEKIREIEAKQISILEENARLLSELEMTKSQIVENSHPNGKKDEEIDELVKEIEYCIGQLKK